MPQNILEMINTICEDTLFSPQQNLSRISTIAKGFAPMLNEILDDYIKLNHDYPNYRRARVKAAKKMLGVDS